MAAGSTVPHEGNEQESSKKTAAVFSELGSDGLAEDVTCVDSLCMGCYQQGVTRLLLTRIPFYKDVVVSSFSCDHCGYSNNQIQSAGPIQDRGVTFEVAVGSEPEDLNRQVIKAAFATISIPSLDLEIPPESQTGTISTIEGILQRVIDGLQQDQPTRLATDPAAAAKVDLFIQRVEQTKSTGNFTMILDDPSGNSFVQNPLAPQKDPKMKVTHYIRSLEQDKAIGMEQRSGGDAVTDNQGSTEVDFLNEVLEFESNCVSCGSVCETKMKQVKIPFFKEVIIMASSCDRCGFRSDEVKSGVGIEPQGVKLTLKVTKEEDLNRDVLKSETCFLRIPELDFEIEHGSLGGRFTTIEGLLTSLEEGLDQLNPFMTGDSAVQTETLTLFKKRFQGLKAVEEPFTLILDDPAGNSFIASLDHEQSLTVERYDRTYEQNDILGINEMKTENYEEDT